MKKHFVIFYCPGTFFNETTEKPIDSWDVEEAMKMAHEVTKRYNATPYGFRFATRERGEDDLDSHQSDSSNMYFLGGKIETLEEVDARNDPEETILRSNMRGNGYDKIIVNTNSWKVTQPFGENDVLLDWKPKKRKAA